jgi:hypothetical protein
MDKTTTCNQCGQEVKVADTLVKRAVFLVPGKGGRQVRSRVVGNVCNPCLKNEPDYNREPWATIKGQPVAAAD